MRECFTMVAKENGPSIWFLKYLRNIFEQKGDEIWINIDANETEDVDGCTDGRTKAAAFAGYHSLLMIFMLYGVMPEKT